LRHADSDKPKNILMSDNVSEFSGLFQCGCSMTTMATMVEAVKQRPGKIDVVMFLTTLPALHTQHCL